MEMEELKNTWNEMNDRLARTENLLVEIKQATSLQESQSDLDRFRNLPLMELVLGLAMAIVFGYWLSAGPLTPQYTASLLILFLLNLAGIIGAAWQLGKLSQADYSGPVLGLQKILAQIHAVRAFSVKWGLILAFLIWVPMSIVIAQAVFHFDIIAKAGWLYVGVNLALGVFAICFCVWFEKRFGANLVRSAGVRRFLDDLTGRSLAKARRSLEDLTRFAS